MSGSAPSFQKLIRIVDHRNPHSATGRRPNKRELLAKIATC